MKIKELNINQYQIKLELFRYIDKLNDKKLANLYKIFILNQQNIQNDFWLSLSDREKQDIELGIYDLDNNNKSDFYEFMKNHE